MTTFYTSDKEQCASALSMHKADVEQFLGRRSKEFPTVVEYYSSLSKGGNFVNEARVVLNHVLYGIAIPADWNKSEEVQADAQGSQDEGQEGENALVAAGLKDSDREISETSGTSLFSGSENDDERSDVGSLGLDRLTVSDRLPIEGLLLPRKIFKDEAPFAQPFDRAPNLSDKSFRFNKQSTKLSSRPSSAPHDEHRELEKTPDYGSAYTGSQSLVTGVPVATGGTPGNTASLNGAAGGTPLVQSSFVSMNSTTTITAVVNQSDSVFLSNFPELPPVSYSDPTNKIDLPVIITDVYSTMGEARNATLRALAAMRALKYKEQAYKKTVGQVQSELKATSQALDAMTEFISKD